MAETELEKMIEVIRSHGTFAYGNEQPEDVAKQWLEWGFSPKQAEEWLQARCFYPIAAWHLDNADIHPEQASKITEEGLGGYRDTIGYKVANNDLEIERAVELAEEVA